MEYNKNNCYRIFVSRRPCFVVKFTTNMNKNLIKKKVGSYMTCLEILRFLSSFSPHIFPILYTTNLHFFSHIIYVFLHLHLHLYLCHYDLQFLAINVFMSTYQINWIDLNSILSVNQSLYLSHML